MSRTKWAPELLSPRGPVYVAIADALARDVEGGRLSPGDRLPTHRDLAESLGVNVVTITRAYAEAKRRGLVDGEVGRGTFVSRVEPRVGTRLALQPDRDGRIDFHFNLPAPGNSDSSSAELLAELGREGFDPLRADYRPAGRPEHREAGAEWLARAGLSTDPRRVVVTGGGQHAMSVALSALCGPGDTVLSAELTYPGFKALASLLHLRALPVAMDADGILPDALEQACRRGNPRVLYCTPTMQNPTGVVWPEKRRREVLEVAERWGVLVLEDDTTAFLAEDPPPPLAELSPECVMYVSSTSKSLGAGLRIGYLHLPASGEEGLATMVERTSANVAAISWMTAPLMAEIASRLIRSGQADRIVAERRAEARARRAIFDRVLGRIETGSHPSCSFVWASLPEPWRSTEFVSEARLGGVAVSAAEAFVVGRAHAPHAVRISIGTPPNREDVERGLEILARMLERDPDVGRVLV